MVTDDEKRFEEAWVTAATRVANAPFASLAWRELKHYPHLREKVMPHLVYAFILGQLYGKDILPEEVLNGP